GCGFVTDACKGLAPHDNLAAAGIFPDTARRGLAASLFVDDNLGIRWVHEGDHTIGSTKVDPHSFTHILFRQRAFLSFTQLRYNRGPRLIGPFQIVLRKYSLSCSLMHLFSS